MLSGSESKGVGLLCCYCRVEVNEPQIFEFRGGVACEGCIRDYYRDRPHEVDSQLQIRQKKALVWLDRNRKFLERQAAERTAPKSSLERLFKRKII